MTNIIHIYNASTFAIINSSSTRRPDCRRPACQYRNPPWPRECLYWGYARRCRDEFTIAHEEDIMFGVIGNMWQRGAMIVVVVRGNGEALSQRSPWCDYQGTRRRLRRTERVALTHQLKAGRKPGAKLWGSGAGID
jgi:hypothetical protein